MSKSMMIVEDEEALRESLSRIFLKDGFTVDSVDSAEEGLKLAKDNIYDIIVSDIILPRMDGIEMLSRMRQDSPKQIFIIMTAYATLDTAVKALREGAYDYITKPIIHEEIKQVVKNALKQRDLRIENLILKKQVGRSYDFKSIIGQSRAIRDVIEESLKIAPARSNVLVLGETGTGKELIARGIHENSPRRDMPFVPINCSAMPDNMLESELFGHVRGAFTGAVFSKKGLLEEADGGTVFLDEIGEFPLALQVKLLRVIEDMEIRPLGSNKSNKADLRFLSATNKDIEQAISAGEFREDLFYRINVLTIKVPPLRQRKSDISLLVPNFLEKYSLEMGRTPPEMSGEAMACLEQYPWPGNIRELQNMMERLTLVEESPLILPEHLPANVRGAEPLLQESLNEFLSIEGYTKAAIMKYQSTHSEQEIADILGITRKTLWEKRKKISLKRPRGEAPEEGR